MKFWNEEEELKAPALLEADIHRIQQELAGRFPEGYIEKLSEQNGGSVVFNSVSVDFENTWSDQDIKPFLPFSFVQPLSYDVYQSNVGTLSEWDVTGKKMIFANGDGSYFYYFNFEDNTHEPSVWCLDISVISNHFVASSFDELLMKLSVQEGEPIDATDASVSFLTMEEILELINHGDEDNALLAYSHWMVIGQEPERLVRELMQRIEQSNNEDQIDSYAGYLAETMINHSEKLKNSLENVIDLLKSKHLITDLSDLIEWLDEEI
ncbi:SMI1/KNR4 family protein [Exiguobacterium sp. R-39]|uniref:SMI1/KNR4 family protein n=1 Tax=Exiguobacterium sp. R-39 TaxID=3416708 RepID=UPI003CE8E156